MTASAFFSQRIRLKYDCLIADRRTRGQHLDTSLRKHMLLAQ